jgi:hypothetical protein
MGKYLRISSYIRKPFLIYDFATACSTLNFLIFEERFFISVPLILGEANYFMGHFKGIFLGGQDFFDPLNCPERSEGQFRVRGPKILAGKISYKNL